MPGLESSPCIEYDYLADGTKLAKRVTKDGETTERLYQNGMVFENGVLDHILTEEGKVVPFIPGNDELLDYQYFVKDHLGNVRSVVREERIYEYLASMETVYSETEESQFSNIAETRQTDMVHAYTGESFAVTDNSQPLGPAFALNVTKGDVVDLSVFGKTKAGGGDETVAGPEAVVAALLDAMTSQSITIGESANTLTTGLADGLAALGMGGSSNTEATGYLNFMLFDKAFNLITVGYKPFTSGSYTEQTIQDITIEEPGYLITYLSYESSAPDQVYFDDFTITLETSTVIQQDSYYPFGLTFNSYSSGTENKYKFQGQEEQKETGWYSFKWRNADPALGRFFNVDPLAEDYYYNSVYAFSENKVVAHVELEGLESVSFEVATERKKDPSKREFYRGKVDLESGKLKGGYGRDNETTYLLLGSHKVEDPDVQKEGNTTTLKGSMEWFNGADYEISMTPNYEFDGDGYKYGKLDVNASIENVGDGFMWKAGSEIGTVDIGLLLEAILSVDGEESSSGEINTTLYFFQMEDNDDAVIISQEGYESAKETYDKSKSDEEGN